MEETILLCPMCQKAHRFSDVEIFTCSRCADPRYMVSGHHCPRPVYRVRTCGCVVDGATMKLDVKRETIETASWHAIPARP